MATQDRVKQVSSHLTFLFRDSFITKQSFSQVQVKTLALKQNPYLPNEVAKRNNKGNSKSRVVKSINNISPNHTIAVLGNAMDATYIDTLVKSFAEFDGGKIYVIVNSARFTWDGVIHNVQPLNSKQLLLKNTDVGRQINDKD
ncbi:hypothetical protein TSTA_107110 [Talaromyces stipitatus ATCC 10500]|uniref:Uncharacterized protein n=1 Tax=Talaromyces stipitatus (strain ATCC 10500 / CBS 375.48 / QM 6759 / NRRL 1006) TaxID=441959 RepID=B8MN54_TALSN|nr:uncharacterized protein TSTA_107110 [Talaromyces stipitatus ATCC 10500]EED14503.1 hypothetical protein TSTA_107110 [Talaromyces stipitatus ATCC 10500]